MQDTVLWRDVPSDREGLFCLHGLGIRERMPPCDVFRPQGWQGYMFMLFHHQVKAGADAEAPLIEPGTLIVWPPGAPQYYGLHGEPWTHSWVFCEGTMIADAFENPANRSSMTLRTVDEKVFGWYLEGIYAEVVNHFTPSWRIVANLMRNIVLDIERHARQTIEPPPVPEAFMAIRTHIDQNLHARHGIEEMAKRVHYSTPHFLRLFRKYFGLSPMEYVMRRRMELAQRYLTDHNLRITEIARRVGYDDIFQFSRMFKRRFGVSPVAMRESLSRRE
jgi:AraC-like DNA-binding protein